MGHAGALMHVVGWDKEKVSLVRSCHLRLNKNCYRVVKLAVIYSGLLRTMS